MECEKCGMEWPEADLIFGLCPICATEIGD